jgi:hypothetical protein
MTAKRDGHAFSALWEEAELWGLKAPGWTYLPKNLAERKFWTTSMVFHGAVGVIIFCIVRQDPFLLMEVIK